MLVVPKVSILSIGHSGHGRLSLYVRYLRQNQALSFPATWENSRESRLEDMLLGRIRTAAARRAGPAVMCAQEAGWFSAHPRETIGGKQCAIMRRVATLSGPRRHTKH